VIIVRIFLSWIPHDPYNQFIRIIYRIADSVLEPIRNALPIQGMGFDFSPIIAFMLLGFLKRIILSTI
jgi:YggT family protein|tara:strand:+ start:195 stop:398 length:204 start_codon:yes stop_codon:yes gene_type:complete